MKRREKKMVVTTFYSKGKSVWIKEWPEMLTDAEILKQNAEIKAKGYGEIDVLTDTTGRLITFVNGDFLREVEEA
jgi:hypothetical protein